MNNTFLSQKRIVQKLSSFFSYKCYAYSQKNMLIVSKIYYLEWKLNFQKIIEFLAGRFKCSKWIFVVKYFDITIFSLIHGKKCTRVRNSFEHPWWVKKNLLKSGIQYSKTKTKRGKPSIKHSTKKLGYTTKDLFIAFFRIWTFLPRLNISKSLRPKFCRVIFALN